MKNIFLMTLLLAFNAIVLAQNVGIGTTSPLNRLHVVHSGPIGIRLENTSTANTEIQFVSTGAIRGYTGFLNNQMEFLSVGNIALMLGTNLTPRLTIAGNGNIDLGDNANAPEKLVIPTGNLFLQNTTKGILLNAADRPIITRAFDPFTSGANIGLGRWGLFMEPSRLVLGIPDIIGKRVEIAGYNANSTRNTLLTIDEDGAMRRPAQNAVNLLPVCMGNINTVGGIVSGTGNFTVDYDGNAGILDITIAGHTYNRINYLAIATCYREQGTKAFATVVENAGKLRIWRVGDNGAESNQAVGFVVYRLN